MSLTISHESLCSRTSESKFSTSLHYLAEQLKELEANQAEISAVEILQDTTLLRCYALHCHFSVFMGY